MRKPFGAIDPIYDVRVSAQSIPLVHVVIQSWFPAPFETIEILWQHPQTSHRSTPHVQDTVKHQSDVELRIWKSSLEIMNEIIEPLGVNQVEMQYDLFRSVA